MSEIDLTAYPKEPPLVSLLATKLYYDGGNKLDDPAYAKLQDELDKDRGDLNKLFWDLVSLEAFNQILVKAGDKATGDRVWTFVLSQRDRYPDLEAVLLSMSQDRSEELRNATHNTTGAQAKDCVAPTFGKAAPKGTTRLSDLVSPDRLRPPPPRKK